MNYDTFLDELENKDRQKENEVHMGANKLCEKLLSNEENPFVDVYPEKKDILKNWFNCTYYRMESAKANEYCNLVGSVLVYLPPFDSKEKFINYFNVRPENFVKYFVENDEFFSCLMGNISEYKQEKVKDVYCQIFQDFKNMGDEIKYPVYANRMENCLLKDEGVTWSDYKEECIRSIKCESQQISIGKLPPKNSQEYIGERIAWLKLIGLEPLAEDIKNMAKTNTGIAGNIAFTANDLFTAPYFYTRKTLKTIAPQFDIPMYKDAITELLKFKQSKIASENVNDIKQDICYIDNRYKSFYVSGLDIKDPIVSSFATSIDDISGHLMAKIIHEEELNDLIFTSNKKIENLKNEMFKNTEKAKDVREEIKDMKNELTNCYYDAFKGSSCIKLRKIRSSFAFPPEADILLDTINDNFSTIRNTLSILYNLSELPRYESSEKKCVKKFLNKYPLLKYNPTIYAWQVK